jgi:hypothetical protein
VTNPVSFPIFTVSSPYTDGKIQTDQYVLGQTTQVTVFAVLTSAKRKAVGPVNLSPCPRSVLISISVTQRPKIVFLWNSKFNFTLSLSSDIHHIRRPGYCSRNSDSLRVGRSEDRLPEGGGGRISAPVQTGPGAHPASYTMGKGKEVLLQA